MSVITHTHRHAQQMEAILLMMSTISKQRRLGNRLEGLDITCACSGWLGQTARGKYTELNATFIPMESSSASPESLAALVVLDKERASGDSREDVLNARLFEILHAWGGDILCVSASCKCNDDLKHHRLLRRYEKLLRRGAMLTLVVFTVPRSRVSDLSADGFEHKGDVWIKATIASTRAHAERSDNSMVTIFTQRSVKTENLVKRALDEINGDTRRIISLSLACACDARFIRGTATALVLVRSNELDNSTERMRAILFFEPNQYSRKAISPYFLHTVKMLRESRQEVCAYALSCGCDPNAVWSKQITQRMPHCVIMAASGLKRGFWDTLFKHGSVEGDRRAYDTIKKGLQAGVAGMIVSVPVMFQTNLPQGFVLLESLSPVAANALSVNVVAGSVSFVVLGAIAGKVTGFVEGSIKSFPIAVAKGLLMTALGFVGGTLKSLRDWLFPLRCMVWIVLFRPKEGDPKERRRKEADATQLLFETIDTDILTLKYANAVHESFASRMFSKLGLSKTDWRITQGRVARGDSAP